MSNRPSQFSVRIARWFDVAVIGLTAAAVCKAVQSILEAKFAPIVRSLSQSPPVVQSMIGIILFSVLVWRTGNSRWRGFFGVRHFVEYPPLWVSIALAWAALCVANEDGRAVISIALLLVAVSIVSGFWKEFSDTHKDSSKQDRCKSSERDLTKAPRLDEFSYEHLSLWLKSDEAITKPNEDLFGHNDVARRIVNRLKPQEKVDEFPTMAIVGRYGSGKSTILSLIKYELERRGALNWSIATVTVSLWPFDTPEAAIRGILAQLTSELGRHVNTLSITGIGSSYVHAIESAGGTFKSIAQLLHGPSQPDEILRSIEDIVVAIDLRIVLWIEDVERFAGADGFETAEARARETERLGAIRALLYQLDRKSHISVVVVDASLQSRFDIEKIARFVETPPRVEAETVWHLISTLRKGSLEAKHIDPTNYDSRMIHSLSGYQHMYAPGEVHVDVFCILRGFPEDRLWDVDGTRLSSGQRGLMSSGIRGRRLLRSVT